MEPKALILMYHMITETADIEEKRYCCPPKSFKRQMHYIKCSGYHVIDLGQLADFILGKANIPDKSLVVTFDDGLKDNYFHAFPVLKECGFSATIFLVTDLVGGCNKWAISNGYPARELLNWDQIREMSNAGVDFGAHTLNHISLSDVSPEVMSREIMESKKAIEENLNKTVSFFSYPYGKFNDTIKNVVQQVGYKAACSTIAGFNRRGADIYALRRIDVYGSDSLLHFILKLKFGTNRMSFIDISRYYLSRMKAKF